MIIELKKEEILEMIMEYVLKKGHIIKHKDYMISFQMRQDKSNLTNISMILDINS